MPLRMGYEPPREIDDSGPPVEEACPPPQNRPTTARALLFVAIASRSTSLGPPEQQAPNRVEDPVAPLRRIEPLPARVVDRYVEQREERGQGGPEPLVEGEELPHQLLAHRPVIVPVLDPEVGAQEVDDRQVTRRLAVGDGAGFEDQPVAEAMRAGELVEEPGLADARL